MELGDLRIENLRLFAEQVIALEPGWNLFVGGNGAGKTTILEAAYLLSRGRSFRVHAREALTRDGAKSLSISALVKRDASKSDVFRVGVGFAGRAIEARVDGVRVAAAELMGQVAVSSFDPGSHSIVVGPAEERRRFIDWGMFHVEPTFLEVWRRYNRALKQRNAALRATCSDDELDVWDHELVITAEPLVSIRDGYAEKFGVTLEQELASLLGELGAARFELISGCRIDTGFAMALADWRQRDRARGYSSIGPHRADWSITFDLARTHHHLSRGQAKLAAFACVIAQAKIHLGARGEYPIICLDDIASELDAEHLQRVMDRIKTLDTQVLASSNSEVDATTIDSHRLATFHVEHGRVRKML